MGVVILIGDVFAMLGTLDDESVDCVCTSPPYWGLRDYGVDGQIGLEPTLGEHIEVMIAVFRELRRVLKKEGTIWLNYGDCYATTPNGKKAAAYKAEGVDDRTFRDKPFSTIGGVLKPKDLCMIPNRLAIALQEDGWWVRSEIIWGKPNPMPDSSGKYRPSTAHEKIFMLTKSGRCYYDAAAVAMPVSGGAHRRMTAVAGWASGDGSHAAIDHATEKAWKKGAPGVGPKTARAGSGVKNNESFAAAVANLVDTRYLRNYEPAPLGVWSIAPQAFSEAHFATFPPELAERCILAGCPPGGTVLDPFGGAGTVGLVAGQHGRDAILIELNPDYAAITQRRLSAGLVRVSGGDAARGVTPTPMEAWIAEGK